MTKDKVLELAKKNTIYANISLYKWKIEKKSLFTFTIVDIIQLNDFDVSQNRALDC